MKPVERLPFRQWADIQRTEKFISVEPRSGYRRALPENDGYVIYLPPGTSDDMLGHALLEALDRSRFIWPPDERDFFKAKRMVQAEQNRHQDVMRRYAYKTKRDLYKNMSWVRVERSEGRMSMKPHRRDKPEYWRSLPPEQTVAIRDTKDATKVGAALRLALNRCE